YNANPVTYDDDDNCVRNCTAIRALAEERPNDNGWGFCIGGHFDCVTDEGQMRDIVAEARANQGVFDDDGHLRDEFLQEQGFWRCMYWTGNDLPQCDVIRGDTKLDRTFDADNFSAAIAAAVAGRLP